MRPTLRHPGWRLLTSLSVCACLLPASARADELIADAPTKAGDTRIQLPKSWQADERASASRTLLRARAPHRDRDATGEFQAVVTLDTDAPAPPKIDGKALQDRIAKSVNNYKPVEEPAPITINGIEAVAFGGTFTSGPVKLRSRQYVLQQNNRLYILTFTTLDSVWPTYAPAIDASANTLTTAAK